MKKIEGPLSLELKQGDPYVDEPVFKDVPVYCAKEPVTTKLLNHYRRTPLIWKKPVRAVNNYSHRKEEEWPLRQN